MEDDFVKSVDSIIAKPCNVMSVIFRDGTEKEIVWQDRSRAESWTDEMREAARQKRMKGRMNADGQ